MDQHVAKRNLSFIIYGGQDEYENFMQVKEWLEATQSVQSTPEFHSYNLEQKFQHAEHQQRAISKFIQKQGGLKVAQKQLTHFYSLLGFDAGRALQIHSYFALTLQEFFKGLQITKLLQQVDQVQALGALLIDENDFSNKTVRRYYKDTISTKLTQQGLNYTISTAPGIPKSGLYFASNLTSYAIVLCTDGQKHYLALTKLKSKSGELLPGVHFKWLGRAIQLVNNWAVELTNVPVLEIVELDTNWRQQLQVQEGQFLIQEARNQLQDVMRMTFLAVKYCFMRRQFMTQDGDKSKSERRVVEYQVTTQRLMNAISFAIPNILALDQLTDKFMITVRTKKQERFPFSIFIKQFAQKTIKDGFEIIETLRETMGGFGFLRFSGAPVIQERALWLYQQQFQDHELFSQALVSLCKNPDKNQKFINQIYGMVTAQDPKRMLADVGVIDDTSVQNPFALYGYYAARTRERFLDSEDNLHPQQVVNLANDIVKAFTGTQFFNLLAFRRYRGANFLLDKIFLHAIQNQLLKNEDNLEYRQTFERSQTSIQLLVRDFMLLIVSSLEMDGTFHDAVVGRENENEFYTTLIDFAKNHNLRNDPKVRAYIVEDLKDFVQRPKL